MTRIVEKGGARFSGRPFFTPGQCREQAFSFVYEMKGANEGAGMRGKRRDDAADNHH
jgi:hypothetical protein